MSLAERTYEERTYTDRNGIEHTVRDYFTNDKVIWKACRKAVGSPYKEDIIGWIGDPHLIVEDGGANGRYYVCFID